MDCWKAFLTYLCTSEVLPTPCDPRTTIFASRLLLIVCGYGGGDRECILGVELLLKEWTGHLGLARWYVTDRNACLFVRLV